MQRADRQSLRRWLSYARPCLEGSVIWVRALNAADKPAEGRTSFEQVQEFQVYDALRDSEIKQEIVFSNPVGVPVRADGQ